MVTVESVSPHVSLIRGPIGSDFVAIYVIVGRRVTLVDTGYAFHPQGAIEPALASLGLSLRDIDLVLTTHGHADHAGGLGPVVAASGAGVGLHREDLARLSGGSARPADSDEFLTAFRRLGLDRRATEREAMLLESTGGTVEIRHILTGGERLDLGSGVAVDVVATPGHTTGSISFIVDPDRIALVGDAIQGLGGAAGLPLYNDPEAYRASLERLGELDVTAAGMGHAFRSDYRGDRWPVVSREALGPLLAESAAAPGVADEVAAAVWAGRPVSTAEAVRDVVRRMPPPYGPLDLELETSGGASLHAALLHLARAARAEAGLAGRQAPAT